MEFDKIRWKLADDLTTDEAQLIVDNKDKLNDEEKAAFADLLQQAMPLSDNPLEDAIDQSTSDTKDTSSASPDSAKPDASVLPATPEQPALPDNVVTKESLDTYIEEKRKEWEAEGKTKSEQDKEEQKIQTYFDAGYTPKDWNDYTNAMVEKVAPVIEQRILARLETQNKKFSDEQDKMRKSQQEVFERFEQEFQVLSKNKLIPDKIEDPDGYEKAHAAIIKLGDENGKTNVTDAYKLWSIIPEEHGGGLVTGNALSPEDKEKQRIDAQKEAAGKVGSGRGAPAGKKAGPPTWASVHSTSMDDLIEQRLSQS